jgi:hypothetical protein
MPLKDGKLNARHFIGGPRDRMIEIQDDFYEKVGKAHDLERGESRQKTKAWHIPHTLAIKAAVLDEKEKTFEKVKGISTEEVARLKAKDIKFFNDNDLYKNFMENQQKKALALATREHLPEIASTNESEKWEKQRQIYDIESRKPAPNALQKMFNKKNQAKKLEAWEKELAPAEIQQREILAEEKRIQTLKNDGADNGDEPLNRLFEMSREQKIKRPDIYKRITERAEEILEKADGFDKYREIQKAEQKRQQEIEQQKQIEIEHREAKKQQALEAARQRERERKQQQQLGKNKGPERSL